MVAVSLIKRYMKPKFKNWLVSLLTGLSFISATAQTPLENLFRLEGNWSGEATLILDGNTFNFIYYADFKKNDEGSGMYMEEWFSHPDLGSLKGYNLIGYNARDEKIHWFSVDNFGTCHDHLGFWKTNDHFYMETTEKHQGKKFEEKIDIVFINENEISLHLVATIGGKLFEDVVVVFKRQTASGRKSDASKESNTAKKPSIIPKETIETPGCKVYPNPAKDQVSFQLPNDISLQDFSLSIFNSVGERIKNVLLQSTTTSISLNGYKAGMYVYKIMNKEQIIYTGKFIVQ